MLGLTYFVMISRPYDLLGLTVSLRFLYGSLPLAVLVSLVQQLPLGVQTHVSAVAQVDPSLEEAAYLFGASLRRTMQRIFLPLLRNSVLVAWMLLFIFVFKEIDILAFLYAPQPFSTMASGVPELMRAPPVMVLIFEMLRSEQDRALQAQGSALLLLACLILLLATLAVSRLGWKPLAGSPE